MIYTQNCSKCIHPRCTSNIGKGIRKMCDEFIDNKENVLRYGDFDSEPNAWNKKQFNRMIWRTRVRMLANAIGAVVLLFLVYTVYMTAIHIYFDTTEVRGKFIRSIISVVELHEDGVRVEKTGNPAIEVTPFLTQKTTLKLYRDVGKWQILTGEVHAKQSITGKFTYSIVNTGNYLNSMNKAAYILPHSIMFDKPMKDRPREEASLKQLNRIEDGNVAQLSFSVDTLMSPEQLKEKLAPYDIIVTEMPIYAGELKAFDMQHSVGGGTDYYVPYLSLRPMANFDEDNWLTSWVMYFTPEEKGYMSEHVAYMMSDLEWMISYIKYSWLDIDKQRFAYLKENGVQVYGASVTGPVRELEKLQEQPEFHDFRLGRIEVWNWE